MTRALLASMMLLACALSCARRGTTPAVRLIDYGIIRPVGPFTQHSDPNSVAGFTSSGPGKSVFERRTTEVPATQGTAFGIRYRIEPIRAGQVVIVEEIIRHPPITKPDGTVLSEERTKDRVTSDTGYIDQKFFYRLGQAYEVVPGDWSLIVAVNGVTAVEQHFTLRSRQ